MSHTCVLQPSRELSGERHRQWGGNSLLRILGYSYGTAEGFIDHEETQNNIMAPGNSWQI